MQAPCCYRPGEGGTGRSLWLGVVAAGLLLICALLGARKRWLRLRLGSIATWTVAHNLLGALAFVLALLHCELQRGGVLTTALLLTLGLLVLSGLIGAIIQTQVPRIMTRLARESAGVEFGSTLVGHWRDLHQYLVQECGPLPRAEDELRRMEESWGVPSPEALDDQVTPQIGAGRQAIMSFYTSDVVTLLSSSGSRGILVETSTAQLAMDALRANVEPSLHELVARIEATVETIRTLIEERRLHRLAFGWQLLHIPLAVLVVLLTTVHIAAALYY